MANPKPYTRFPKSKRSACRYGLHPQLFRYKPSFRTKVAGIPQTCVNYSDWAFILSRQTHHLANLLAIHAARLQGLLVGQATQSLAFARTPKDCPGDIVGEGTSSAGLCGGPVDPDPPRKADQAHQLPKPDLVVRSGTKKCRARYEARSTNMPRLEGWAMLEANQARELLEPIGS